MYLHLRMSMLSCHVTRPILLIRIHYCLLHDHTKKHSELCASAVCFFCGLPLRDPRLRYVVSKSFMDEFLENVWIESNKKTGKYKGHANACRTHFICILGKNANTIRGVSGSRTGPVPAHSSSSDVRKPFFGHRGVCRRAA